MIGLEPSCVSVFRDEMTDLLPRRRRRPAAAPPVFLLSEFLEQQAKDYTLPRLERKALVHGHCHHKSVFKLTDEEKVLTRIGLDYEVLDSGCCGMAGAFGFEEDHYDVSMQCGERVLLPAVRQAASRTADRRRRLQLPRADRATTGRQALHLAQVLQMAMRDGPRGPADALPEARYAPVQKPAEVGAGALALAGAGALLAGGALLWGWHRRRSFARGTARIM